jgi:signal transduction histidine kinase
MSGAHDIEQIARAIEPDLFANFPKIELYRSNYEAAYAKARAILPLLSAAREEGAREMRERAADEIHDHVAGTYEERIAIMCAIRALPIKEG